MELISYIGLLSLPNFNNNSIDPGVLTIDKNKGLDKSPANITMPNVPAWVFAIRYVYFLTIHFS